MNEPVEVPKPTESGSDGTQKIADSSRELVLAKPLVAPMAEAITGLAVSHSRAFGGEVASTLIAGATSQMAIELNEAKYELARLREKLETATKDLTEEKVKAAVLNARIQEFRSTRHIKNIGIAVGTLLVGIGVSMAQGNTASYGVAAVVVGSLLVIVGWFTAPKEGEK